MQGKEQTVNEEVWLSTKGVLYALYSLFQNLRKKREELQVSKFNTFIRIQFYWMIFNCKQVCILDSVWNKSLQSANINIHFPFALGQL